MNINLKQSEIESAIQGYINAQGISLHNKDVSINFTAGRKNSGLSAEVTIEDSAKPLIPSILARTPAHFVATSAEAFTITPQGQVVVEEEVEVPIEEATVKTTSLFG